MSDRLEEIRAALAAATPGPWHETGFGEIESDARDERGFPRMVIYDEGGHTGADAKLIANAPVWLAELCDEVERLVAETQRLTRERDELATWKAHVVEPCIACGAPMLLICGVCSDKHWNEKLTALRAAGQRLHDTAEAYRHHDERRSWIDDADALDAAFVGWARLTTKEPTP